VERAPVAGYSPANRIQTHATSASCRPQSTRANPRELLSAEQTCARLSPVPPGARDPRRRIAAHAASKSGGDRATPSRADQPRRQLRPGRPALPNSDNLGSAAPWAARPLWSESGRRGGVEVALGRTRNVATPIARFVASHAWKRSSGTRGVRAQMEVLCASSAVVSRPWTLRDVAVQPTVPSSSPGFCACGLMSYTFNADDSNRAVTSASESELTVS
jgi:hypothetical protein